MHCISMTPAMHHNSRGCGMVCCQPSSCIIAASLALLKLVALQTTQGLCSWGLQAPQESCIIQLAA